MHHLSCDDGGAGFYRFPAWVEVKSNDVSLGHAIAYLQWHRSLDYRGNRLGPLLVDPILLNPYILLWGLA